MPLVSTVIPTYNRAGTLQRAIESALHQKDVNLEVVVVDDGSTDVTAELLRSYGSKIKSIRQERSGSSAARNAGIAAATGEFVAFLDSDDEWLPEKTQIQIRHFDASPNLGIVGCSAWFIENGRIYDMHWQRRPGSLRPRLLSGPINTSGVMVRRSCLVSLEVNFRTDLHVYEDSELWWRVVARYDSLMLPNLLVKSHRIGDSLSGSLDVGEKLRNVQQFYEYVLSDERVRETIGPDMKRFVSHRHYVASCSHYVNRRYSSAWAEWLAGLREDPRNPRWIKLAAVISLPPALRPVLKRAFAGLLPGRKIS